MAYAAGWKKFEPLWDFVIRTRRAGAMLPVLEAILSEFGRRSAGVSTARSPVPVNKPIPTALESPPGQLLQIQR